MVYVHHPSLWGVDLPAIYFENNDASPPNRIQLKAYKKDDLFRDLVTYPPPIKDAVSFEPIVPFMKVTIKDFHSHAPFQYVLLCQSPGFTPAAADALKVTDKDGHMLRYPDGEPCKRVLGPDDNPRQIAARLARGYHREYGGRAFWGDIASGKGSPV